MYLNSRSSCNGDGRVVDELARSICIDVVVGFPKELVFCDNFTVAFELDFVIYFGV